MGRFYLPMADTFTREGYTPSTSPRESQPTHSHVAQKDI